MRMKTTGKVIPLSVLFLLYSLSVVSDTLAQTTPPQNDAQQIVLTTSVTNKKGNLVTGLARDDFQVFIDKQPAKIEAFREEDPPLSVGILFDTSASVSFSPRMRPLIKSAQEALKTFLDKSNQQNEYFLMAFNSSPEILLDWTSDSKALLDTIGIVRAKGNTAFYDACYLALDKIRHGRYSKRVLLVISDGADNISEYTSVDVRDELKASDVAFYSLNFSGYGMESSSLGSEAQIILDELSSASGGRSFYQRLGKSLALADAISAFEIIAEELRHQYTITVTPNFAAADNKWHRVKIKVQAIPEMKQLSARARAGFYMNHR